LAAVVAVQKARLELGQMVGLVAVAVRLAQEQKQVELDKQTKVLLAAHHLTIPLKQVAVAVVAVLAQQRQLLALLYQLLAV
jgi:hypothetical protein